MTEHADTQTKNAMDRMYKWTRHVYDASRKYYLLGRDHLIQHVKPKTGEHVIAVGSGTARNIIKMARQYPSVHFYGLDASDEMLKTARNRLKSEGFQDSILLKQGFAQNFDPKVLFGLASAPDKLVFSYSLSIIPPWQASLDHAVSILDQGGEIHIVDFGGCKELPKAFREFLFWWLKIFHVYHKPEILDYLQSLDKNGLGTLRYTPLYKEYAYYAVFKKG